MGALEIVRSPTPGVVELEALNTTPVSDDFTIEVLANLEGIEAATLGANLAAQAAGPHDVSQFSWVFMVRNGPFEGSVPRELMLIPSDKSQWYGVTSGILIDERTDYYLAASFDLDGKEATFYAHNLANNVLQIATVPHVVPSLNPFSTLGIGGTSEASVEGLIDEIRLSRGLVNYEQLLLADAFAARPGSGIPAEVQTGPRAVYSITSGTDRIIDLRKATSVNIGEQTGETESRLVAKFGLPQFAAAADQLETARLRMYLTSVSGEPADLVVWHSALDNDFDRLASDFDDASYEETTLNLIMATDAVGSYYEVDVTDLVLANYLSDTAAPVAAFRLQLSEAFTGDSALFRLAMPRDVGNQPQLVLTFVPEPTTAVLALTMLVSAYCAGRARRNRQDQTTAPIATQA
jgi:hypothetical protein